MVSLPTHEEISARAFQIYVASGYVAGRDLENWLQAEAELTRELQGGSGSESMAAGRALRHEESRSSQSTPPASGGAKAATAKPSVKRGVRPKGISSKTP